jgi:exopolysaccharide biosynthesis predicted pyruvyltransferase EpsI
LTNNLNRTELIEIINKWLGSSRSIHYATTPGNAGDAAISCAAFQVFRKLNVSVRLIDKSFLHNCSHLVIGGGGNLVPYYTSVANIIEKSLRANIKKCLLLPHTIRGNETLLAKLDYRFTLLCRDYESFVHVRRFAPHADVILCRDLVADLDLIELCNHVLSMSHKIRLLSDFRWIKKFFGWRFALMLAKPSADGILRIIRTDKESSFHGHSLRLHDLMRYYSFKKYGAGCDQVTFELIKLFMKTPRVITDRLHASLLASLAGSTVCILENSYGKNAAVWETVVSPVK